MGLTEPQDTGLHKPGYVIFDTRPRSFANTARICCTSSQNPATKGQQPRFSTGHNKPKDYASVVKTAAIAQDWAKIAAAKRELLRSKYCCIAGQLERAGYHKANQAIQNRQGPQQGNNQDSVTASHKIKPVLMKVIRGVTGIQAPASGS